MEDLNRMHKDCEKSWSFWTICPYCYYVYEYDAVYKECCLRCQHCRRAFHAAEIHTPPPRSLGVVDGDEGYFCRIGCFNLQYPRPAVDMKPRRKKVNAGAGGRCVPGGESGGKFIKVSSDEGGHEKKNDGKEGEGVPVQRRRNIKCPAWNTKKIMGRGVRLESLDIEPDDSDDSEEEEEKGKGLGEMELDFDYDGNDILVGI